MINIIYFNNCNLSRAYKGKNIENFVWKKKSYIHMKTIKKRELCFI